MQDCGNSSANALELPQSCTNPSIQWGVVITRCNKHWYHIQHCSASYTTQSRLNTQKTALWRWAMGCPLWIFWRKLTMTWVFSWHHTKTEELMNLSHVIKRGIQSNDLIQCKQTLLKWDGLITHIFTMGIPIWWWYIHIELAIKTLVHFSPTVTLPFCFMK